MTLLEWRNQVWSVMEAKGFHAGRANSRDDVLVRLCLIHTEVSEAAQEVKRRWVGQGDDATHRLLADELADVMIRVLDLCGCVGIDPEKAVATKMTFNEKRPQNYGTPNEGQV